MKASIFDVIQDASNWDQATIDDFESVAGNVIKTGDKGAKTAITKGTITKTMEQVKDWAIQEALVQLKKAGDVAYKQALRFFLNTLAYDTATYLATGDKGQAPMFETDGWGAYLKNAADGAAGTFLEQIGKKNGLLQFNLCRPDPNVLLKISLGLDRNIRPKAPACTFSELTKNWDTALKSKDFLPKFQDMFNPWSNDLGIALTLQTGMETAISKEVNTAAQDRIEGLGIKPVKDPVSGKIKTPVSVVREFFYKPVQDSTSAEKVYTGSIVADSIDVFLNTLVGKLMDKWLKKGIVTNFAGVGGLTNPNALNPDGGIAAAEDQFRSLIEPNFKTRGDYDVLSELVACPDPNKAGPTNCVIDEKFRQAIEKRLTVVQALEQGYLSRNSVFGFSADGLEPRYNEGYPYRSMLILRKFRILPMGWEVAAQKLKDQQNIIKGTKNLSDLVNCFSNTDGYAGYYDSWCAGLVDPSWVLKAPQNFCKREGAGPEILSEVVAGEGASSVLSILRNDTYCADEQSCIKEKNDGSCELYGYCAEERRQWDFNANSCTPRNNTCQTFKAADGNTVSYLENTLNYGACNAGSDGCLAYCRDYNLTSGKFTCTAVAGSKIYLNGQAESCESDGQGCHEFIRLTSGGGANLLVNSDFEEPLTSGGWSAFGSLSSQAYQGAGSLKMNGSRTKTIAAGATGYNIAGENYVLSFYAKDCASGDRFLIEDKPSSLSAGGDWTRYALNYTYPINVPTNTIRFTISSSACLIDNIKLEKGTQATAYGDYAAAGAPALIYEKIAPSYLNCAVANPPAECQNFSRYCSADEAGCELYSSVANNTKIPARVAGQDYCPAECVGYNSHVQSETAFDSSRDAYFIPKTAKTCSAEAAGCDQFTNLDEVAKGGEGVEYYTYLRQCLKKTDNEGSCAEFYNWEGSDESGYQLKVESLKKTGSGLSAQPAVSQDDSALCDKTVYNLPASDPAYNPDCRQFYNRDGGLSYHLYSRTITCSDDCHPYRRTALNVDDNIASAAACSGLDKHWNNAAGECVVCKNGGVWSADNNACIYQAVPNQGVTCSAAQNGCREYVGNTGNDVRKIFTDDFSGGTSGAWSGVGGSTVTPSSEALILDADNKGNSIKISGGAFQAKRPVGSAVSSGRAYVLSFMAKASASADLNISLAGGGSQANFVPLRLTASWQIYEASLADLNHEVAADEYLLLQANLGGGGSYYIDNITLTEIVDRYYLIKNSWRTPESCYNDIAGNLQGDMYNLGCAQYTDRAGKLHNLRQFSKLCSESAVGCELMIDTQNSANPNAEVFNAADAPGRIAVPADSFAYVVYDSDKLCGVEQKGCERLGKPYQYENTTLYGDVYLKNNPDKYGEILCASGAAGCQAYAYDNGESYFKDPGDQVCEWRQQVGAGQSQGWFRKRVKKCDVNGNKIIDSGETGVCLADADCSANIKCQLETSDIACAVDTDSQGLSKTFGFGGLGNQVSQPSGGWAGICPAADSGCTEYVDPLSKSNANLIFNGDFQNLDGNPATVDGWSGNRQEVSLEANTVYRLAHSDNSQSATIGGCSPGALYELDANNNLGTPKTSISVTAGNRNGKIFYFKATDKGSCGVSVGGIDGAVELRPVAIDYQLRKDLDRQSCNGLVNYSKNCVLFNERKQAGAALAKLDWDADATEDGEAPQGGAVNDSNVILKVAPDRTCDKWLACRSFVKNEKGENVCFDIGLCDAVDDNGNCKSFVNSPKINQTVGNLSDANKISNLSGYAKAGLAVSTLKTDYYPLGAMKQAGEMSEAANGGFEYYGSNGYPIGWNPQSGGWTSAKFSVINNPIAAQSEGIGYPVEGQSFLKFSPSAAAALSEFIDVEPNADYFVSFKINTANYHTGAGFDLTAASMSIMTFDALGRSSVKGAPGASNDIELCNGSAANMPWINGCASLTNSGSQGWEDKIFSFRTGSNTHRIKLMLNGYIWWGWERCRQASNSDRCENRQGIICHPSHSCTLPGGTVVQDPCGWGDTITMTSDACAGNIYFDDVKIRPALNSKDNWHTAQTCRLYPKSDSLACDYYEASGARQKGWYGYCLEYDRPPGDPKACLLWYPVDKVKGDGVEEAAGYQGKMPVYYTLEARANRVYEYRHVYKSQTASTEGCKASNCPDGYGTLMIWCSKQSDNDPTSCVCEPNKKDAIALDGSSNNYDGTTDVDCHAGIIGHEVNDPVSEADGWYPYDGVLSGISYTIGSDNKFVNELCGNATGCTKNSELFRTNLYTNKIVQTVSAVGQNKFWSSRVYKGTSYKVPGFNFTYDSDSAPFGSMTAPAPANNPYEWDGDGNKLNNQPIYSNTPASGAARSGQVYGCVGDEPGDCSYVVDLEAEDYFPYKYLSVNSGGPDNSASAIQRLFAQSYGAWEWGWDETAASGRYLPASGLDWGVPTEPCRGTGQAPRPAAPNDICGIKPSVNNIKINGSASTITFNKNGFANLTFTTTVDGDQLPMVMYAVDWGDGEKTIVSGVEMRDRPNPLNPHSLYHLYSYWDLKAKANGGVAGVSCSGDTCTVKPMIKIKDNWGWCNDGSVGGGVCDRWAPFGGSVAVKEK